MKRNKIHKIIALISSVCLIIVTVFLYSCGGGGSSISTPSGSWGTLVWGTGNWGGP